jgi:hypothetical protein
VKRCLSLDISLNINISNSCLEDGYESLRTHSPLNMSDDVAEPALDPNVRELLQWGTTIAYWIGYPVYVVLYYAIYYIAFGILLVLKLLYRPLEFILLPVFYLLRFIGSCLIAPFQFLARFEVQSSASEQAQEQC